jgi:hypothetical protein
MKHLPFRIFVGVGIATTGPLAVMAACSSSSPATTDYDNGATSGSSGTGSSGGTASSGGTGSSGSSSGSSDDSDGGTGNTQPFADATLVMYDGPPPNVDGGKLLCATPNALPIQFNPMYSGFDGMHMYQIPSFVMGVDPATVTWGSSDPTMVDFQPYVTGIMITTKKAGDVTIVATAVSDAGATVCGTATLHIAQYTVDEWNLGNMRYNNGNGLEVDARAFAATLRSCDASVTPSGFDGNYGDFDGNLSGFDGNIPGFDGSYGDYDATAGIAACLGNPFDSPPAACTNCHGDVGNGKLFGMSLFTDVSHTPEQTGGFSDQDLVSVFVDGVVPSGGYFDSTVVPYATWHDFHRWADINTAEEQTGMVAYLRSLTPKEQLGCNDIFRQGAADCK